MNCDTLWIDTARATCTLTWRGYVESPPARGRVLVATEAPGQRLSFQDVERLARPAEGPMARPPESMTMPFLGRGGGAKPSLPFTGQATSASSRLASLGAPKATIVPHNPQEPPRSSTTPAWLGGPRTMSPSIPPPAPASAPAPPAPVMPALAAASALLSVPTPGNSPWAVSPMGALVTPVEPAPPPLIRPGGPALSIGAAAAPDAAAGVEARAAVAPPSAPRPVPVSEKPARAPAEIFDLIWYDERSLPRIRARWEALVTELDFEPAEPGADLGADDAEKARGRHNVFGVLTDGEAIDVSGVARAVRGAVNDRGRFTPPLVLVAGDLRFPFDEVETLRATLVAATPLAGTDKRLKETIDSLNELLQTPYLQGSTGLVEKLLLQLRDQVQQANRALPASYLDGHVERLLLEQRRYQIRKVFGGEFIRAFLAAGAPEETPVPVYLPRHLDQTLPMMSGMKVRVVAEANVQQDQYDASPHALRAVALGRALPLDGFREGAAVARR